MEFPLFPLPLSEGAVEGMIFVGLLVFTGRPTSFNAQACQWKCSGQEKKLPPKNALQSVVSGGRIVNEC